MLVSTLTVPQRVVAGKPSTPARPSSSGDCPIAETAIEQGRSNSEPSRGTGFLRPEESGSPSFILWHLSAFSFPPSATIPTGAASSSISTPSCRASSISMGSAGISAFVLR